MTDNTLLYLWLTLKYRQNMPFFVKLVEDCGTIADVYEREDYSDLQYLRGTDKKFLLDKSLKNAEKVIEECKHLNIDIITFEDDNYPYKFRQLYQPPVVLYTKGKLPDFDNNIVISVVGARDPIDSSRRVTDEIVRGLADNGFIIVSGLAYGIDSVAHKAALMSQGVTTGFLARGLDKIYPVEHTELADFVMSSGGIISEYPPGVSANRENFNPRNRLISGIADGVIVVQAAEHSGTSLTVTHAISQNKDIFVVPGDVYLFTLSNNLIKNGAKPVTCALDIIEEYMGVYPDKMIKQVQQIDKPIIEKPEIKKTLKRENVVKASDFVMTENEKNVYTAIQKSDGISFENLAKELGYPAHILMSALSLLEMKGYVLRINGIYRIK
ncbi:MAG: DNA-processing protein DprA [Clostridia bacterium]|nr:DNA-processing protein DprA [Clostridia bacterium]